MKIIGLTGGIGSGKSTVSSYLEKKGCKILDCDMISRKMTEKGSPALEKIRKQFGSEYFLSDGTLDRKALGDFVFNNRSQLDVLQKIITEKVIEHINNTISYLKDYQFEGIIVIDAPLLFECGMENIADENWLVTASIDTRLERVSKRDGLSKEQILLRINNQMSEEEKEKLSNCVLDNSTDLDELFNQIDMNLERIYNEY